MPHYTSYARRYELFAELFAETMKLGLVGSVTQHPGLYYEQSAFHSMVRRALARQLCRNALLAAVATANAAGSGGAPGGGANSNSAAQGGAGAGGAAGVLDGLYGTEFWAQRPWRPASQSIEAPDPVKERDGIAALQALEAQVLYIAYEYVI